MKKLSFLFLIVLAVVYNGSALGAAEPEFVALQRQMEDGAMLTMPSLNGRLKPIAHFLDHKIQWYLTCEESHPIAAKVALKSALVLSKGLFGGIAGIISREAYGCLKGFRSGVRTAVRQEIVATGLQGTVGSYLDDVVQRGVSTLTPMFKRLDPLLDDNEAKTLAISLICFTFSISEVKEVIKGARLSIGRPHLLPEDYQVSGQLPMPVDRSQLHNGHAIHEHIHTVAHGAESGFFNTSIEEMFSHDHQEFRADAQLPIDSEAAEILKQSGHDLASFLTETVQEQVRENIRTSSQVGLLERQTDQPAAAGRMQDLFASAAREEINYQITRNTVADMFTGFSAIMFIAGDHKVARQIATVGSAGVTLMDSCRMLSTGASTFATGTSALAGLGGAGMTASCICPYVGIACAVASLASLAADDGSDGLGEALQQIHQSVAQMHQSLSSQIYVVHEHMMERFDNLDSNIDSLRACTFQGFQMVLEQSNYLRQDVRRLHGDMNQGFRAMSQGIVGLSQQMRDFTASNAYSFERIHRDLQKLYAIDAKIESHMLKPFFDARADIELCRDGEGSLEAMPEPDVRRNRKKLERVLLGYDPTWDNLNGYICADWSISPQASLGYCAKYMTSQLGIPLPSTVNPPQLPNLDIFVCALGKYLALRQATVHIPHDIHGKILQRIKDEGKHALTFIGEVQGNRVLFRKLYANYEACYAKVLDLYYKALANKSQELLDAVLANAVEKTCQAIETYPLRLNSPAGTYLTARQIDAEKDKLRTTLVEWIAQNKSRYKVDLAQSAEELLANPDNKILNAFALPERLNKGENGPPPIPLDCRSKEKILESYICKHAVIAERLGLGNIELKYLVNQNNTISVKAIFVTKDKAEIPAGTVILATNTIRPFTTVNCLGGVIEWHPSAWCTDKLIYMFAGATNPKALDSATKSSGWSYADYLTRSSLDKLILKGLAEHRQEALAALSAPTELGVRYQQAVEELQSSYHAIQAFGTIAGLSKEELQRLPGLKTNDANSYLHACMENIPADTSLSSKLEGALVPTPRFLRACIPAERTENPFSEPLRGSLARLRDFAKIYPGIAQQREREREELARRMQEEREAAQQVPTPRELALEQRLRDIIEQHNVQMAAMMGMMQQTQNLLLQHPH